MKKKSEWYCCKALRWRQNQLKLMNSNANIHAIWIMIFNNSDTSRMNQFHLSMTRMQIASHWVDWTVGTNNQFALQAGDEINWVLDMYGWRLYSVFNILLVQTSSLNFLLLMKLDEVRWQRFSTFEGCKNFV